jgi:hypothetical protein
VNRIADIGKGLLVFPRPLVMPMLKPDQQIPAQA